MGNENHDSREGRMIAQAFDLASQDSTSRLVSRYARAISDEINKLQQASIKIEKLKKELAQAQSQFDKTAGLLKDLRMGKGIEALRKMMQLDDTVRAELLDPAGLIGGHEPPLPQPDPCGPPPLPSLEHDEFSERW